MSDQPTIPCPCGEQAVLVTGKEVYPHRPDLHAKHFYLCECGRYVGCHKDTTKAKGVPADAETRAARMGAHKAFDPIWQLGPMRRKQAYKWLARKLGVKEIHIGEAGIETCRRIVEICS